MSWHSGSLGVKWIVSSRFVRDNLATLAQKLPRPVPRRHAKSAPVVLLVDTSWWPIASRIAIAFQDVGCIAAAVCPPRGHPLLKTRGVGPSWPYGAMDPLGTLTAAIQAADPDLIVPCDDRSVRHLHELYAAAKGPSGRRMRDLISQSLGLAANFDITTSRYALMHTAVELGIRVPNSMPIRSAADLHQWSTEQELPWFLKADGTWGGHGVRLATGPDAENHYRELTRPLSTIRFLKRLIVNRDPFWWETWRKQTSSSVMAQARVIGKPANSAIACWQGRVLAQVCVEVVEAQGPTGPATIVRVVQNAEMQSTGEKLVSRLGLSGIIGLDFMIEDQTGDAYLIELNPRCTPLCHLKHGKGGDLIGMLGAQLSGQSRQERPAVTHNDLVAYFPQAWRGNTSSDLLQASFQDVPLEDPDLVDELLQTPWPDRGILARLTDRMRGNAPGQRASRRIHYRQSTEHRSSIAPLRPEGTKLPLFLIHGVDGTVDRFHNLVRFLDPDRPVYGIESQALQNGKPALCRMEDLAAFYVSEVRALQDHGPYHFVGFSFGGLVAFEMALQLQDSQAEVGLLAMVDNVEMGTPPAGPASARAGIWAHLRRSLQRDGLHYAASKFRTRSLKAMYWILAKLRRPIPAILKSPSDINWFAGVRYKPEPFTGRLTLFQASSSVSVGRSMDSKWRRLASGGVETRMIAATHENLFSEPQVRALANEIQDCISMRP
jgi:thioesterase domain-containing protein